MEELSTSTAVETDRWYDRPLSSLLHINTAAAIFLAILAIATFTRFYILGDRVMSHDETSHVYFSWMLYTGKGYSHDPITHGPLQFHLIALSYFLFGDNDFSGRVPAALFSIATVAMAWAFKRYLGRSGTLITAALLTISPYIFYYGRYARNEAFVGLFGLLMWWSILRYIETGKPKFLLFLTLSIVLHITSKETAYIYVAQALVFFGLYFIYSITQKKWQRPGMRKPFLEAILFGLLLLAGAGVFKVLGGVDETAGAVSPVANAALFGTLTLVLAALALVALAIAVFLIFRGFGIRALRAERSFDLIVLTLSLFLPLLSAFPMSFLNINVPTNVAEVSALSGDIGSLIKMGSVLGASIILAVVVGMWWNPNVWALNAALFYGIFVVFYTTLFTNGAGLFTGLVGGLGYWLEQQGVNRGNQPGYYYWLIQVPVYEYLPTLGAILAGILALFGWRAHGIIVAESTNGTGLPEDISTEVNQTPEDVEPTTEDETPVEEEPIREPLHVPVLSLLGFWSITSLLAYTVAGEKMPWLTFHITLPMILLAGWALGVLVDSIQWRKFIQGRGLIALVLTPVFLISLFITLGSLLGPNPPFQGKTLEQLSDTSTFLIAFLGVVISGGSLFYILGKWPGRQTLRLVTLGFFTLFAVLTLRTSITANFISYDNANELLVYAHSGPGNKIALKQIEDISRRTTNGLDIQVAYDDQTQYPFWWYLRDFHNVRFYGSEPTRDLREMTAILVGDSNYQKLEPIVRNDFYQFEYIRMWWPNQDYFNLTWDRVKNALTDPQWRKALWEIWLNRDYTLYGQLTGQDTSLEHWSPAQSLRLYLRKDVVAQLWDYGSAPVQQVDPYANKQAEISADNVFGSEGSEPGQFLHPKGIAVAQDGTLYITDTGNNRIQHVTAEGEVLQVWGSFGSIENGEVPGGQFYEPWGIAVDSQGYVYVADLWNHRIQKFTPEGEFMKMWGVFGTAETPFALWGPRDIAIDSQDRLFVTDTGNKRIVVYNTEGEYLFEFGTEGFDLGQFAEPVGIDFDSSDRLFVADTWNMRVQVLAPDPGEMSYSPYTSWDINGWFGESLDNKPYLAVDVRTNRVYVTDPEGFRVLVFSTDGEFIEYFGDYGSDNASFGVVNGIAVDPSGGVWVLDSGNSRVMHFPVE